MIEDALNLGPILTAFFLGLSVIILLYRFSIRNYDYFEKKGIPFAKPFPFVGSVLQNIGRPLHETECKRYKELGPIYGHFEGHKPLLTVAKPPLLRDVLIKDFQFFTGRRVFETGDKTFDANLSIVQGEDWKRIRTIITPTFTTGKIKRMLGIFEDCSKTLVRNFEDATRKGEDVELKRMYGAFTMDVIGSCAFSTKVDSHSDPDNPFVRHARNVFTRNVNWRFMTFLISPTIMKLFKISLFDPKSMSFFREASMQIINERKRTGQKRNDFLQLLLDTAHEVAEEQKWEDKESDDFNNYGDEPNTNHQIFRGLNLGKKHLSMNELVAQCMVFFIAGYDSTATTLSVCTYQLALNQEVQRRLREEVDGIIEEHGGKLTYEGIQQMKYLDNVVSETLRMYPPGIRLERTAEVDYTLGDTGITVPKGTIVGVPVYAMHHDPELFPDPETFDPDRFTAEEKAKREPYTYIPFGVGPRNCVAMRFALIEIKVCLAYVIAHYCIQRSHRTEVPLDFSMTQVILQPKAIHVKFQIRDDCPLKS